MKGAKNSALDDATTIRSAFMKLDLFLKKGKETANQARLRFPRAKRRNRASKRRRAEYLCGNAFKAMSLRVRSGQHVKQTLALQSDNVDGRTMDIPKVIWFGIN